MEKIYNILVLVFLISVAITNNAYSKILFEDNFDNSPDWQSRQTISKSAGGQDIYVFRHADGSCTGACPGGNCKDYCPPIGWAGYYVAASAWADSRREDTYVLSTEGAYGGTGKGLTYNHESTGNWAGGRLLIWLGEVGYDELYVRMRIKYGSNWSWSDGTGHAQQKWMRISSYWADLYNENPNIFQFQSTGLNESVFYPDFYYNNSTGATSFQTTCMGSPNYYGVEWSNYSNFPAPAAGQWHVIEFRVKMNSSPGIADGIYEAWLDGSLKASKNSIVWRQSGSATNWGWNAVMPLDNLYTTFNSSLYKEQKMYMDDIVVSTTYVGTDYVIKNSNSKPVIPIGFKEF